MPELPGGSDGKSIYLQCRRPRFDPWVGKIPWRRKWQPTPVLLPGKFHGRRNLIGYSPWGRKESDRTERLHFHFHFLLACVAGSCQDPCLRDTEEEPLWEGKDFPAGGSPCPAGPSHTDLTCPSPLRGRYLSDHSTGRETYGRRDERTC